MCDQDHFEKDRQDYETLGLVITRRQFGVMLGAGRASGERHGSRRSGVAGHLRAAAGVPSDG